jgi:hypothetical protein
VSITDNKYACAYNHHTGEIEIESCNLRPKYARIGPTYLHHHDPDYRREEDLLKSVGE